MSSHCLSTELIINSNPITFERELTHPDEPRYRLYHHSIYLNGQDGIRRKIGNTGLVIYEDSKELHWPTLDERIKGTGIGVAVYVAASGLAVNPNHNPPLRSSNRRFLSTGAERVWKSLTDRGMAEKPEQVNGFYQYIGPVLEHVIDKAQDGEAWAGNFDRAELR